MMKIEWTIKSFNELTTEELYRILKLRMETFVLEQKCIYLDLDDMDQTAFHLIGVNDGQIIAYARIQINDTSSSAIIRRVIVHQDFRKRRLGNTLMLRALSYIESLKNILFVELSAQFHLKVFYENLGFETSGAPYFDTGIKHIKMVKQVSNNAKYL